MSGASVSPCTTSVSTITHIAIRMIASRYGNGVPPATVTGSARAVASVTIPRMLVHATTAAIFGVGGVSSRRTRALRTYGAYAAIGTQTSRTTIATAPSRKPARRSDTPMSRGTAASSSRNWTPSRRKIAALRTKMTSSHTERLWSLESGATALEK